MMRSFWVCLMLIAVSGYSVPGSAEQSYILNKGMADKVILSDWTKLYNPESSSFNIEHILAGDSIKFRKADKDFGHDFEFRAVVWAKIKLRNSSPSSQIRLLSLSNRADSIFVYEITDHQISYYSEHDQASSLIAESIPKAGNHVFIHLDPGQEKIYYIKSIFKTPVKSEHYSHFSLHDVEKSIEQFQLHIGMQSFYLGMLLIFGVLGFFQFFVFREKVFLYFGLSACFFVSYFAIFSLLFETLIYPLPDQIRFWCINISILGMITLCFLLVSSYISLKEFLPRYYTFFYFLTLFITVARLLDLIVFGGSYLSTFVFNLFLMAWIITALIPISRLALKGSAASRKLLMAMSGLMITFFIFILGLMQIITINIWVQNSVQIGTLFFFMLVFIGMIEKVNFIKEEKNAVATLAKLKSRFFANVSHEFRTPLTVILGMANQIRKDPKKHLDHGVRLIESNGKTLLHLINQLLDLSKLENQSVKLNLQRGNIVAYLSYLTESYTAFANSKNLSLRFSSSVESLVMDYDPERIKNVLTNLISNAVKFTPSGGEIRVRVSQENDTMLLEVRDSGIGIAEADLPYIFNRFYQADGTQTFGVDGTGIGLSFTLELVELMGGEISVKSKSGKGSSFTVKLPIHLHTKETIPRWNPMENSSETIGINLKTEVLAEESSEKPQLLLIEDNPDLVEYLKSCLGDLYHLDVALNGRIGIEKAIDKIPDIIISDVMMPEKDGFEVCETLKSDQRTSHIPIVLLTAKADHNSRIEGLSRGADAYIAKPFDEEELLVRIQVLLENQKRMAAWFSNRESETVSSNGLEEALQVEGEFVQKVQSIIEDNYTDENFALPQLCREIGMSRSQLFRKMTVLVRKSPSEFIRSFRLQKAKEFLMNSSLNVSEVAWKVGFKDPSHFSKSFQEEFGKLPSDINK